MKFQLSDIPLDEMNRMESILKDSNLKGSNLRELILKSELKDFEKLKNIKFLEDLIIIITERSKLERRNSFNPNIYQKYSVVCESINELSDFIESQLNFYEERISEIEDELKSYEELKLKWKINIEENLYQLLSNQK